MRKNPVGDCPRTAAKVLSEQLGELVADEIVARDGRERAPAPVTYSLTGYGRSLMPLVESVRAMGNGHIERFRVNA